MSIDVDPEAARGAELSLDQLFRAEGPRILRLLRRRLPRSDDAADLLQECFMRLMRVSQGPASPNNPQAYLVRIADNLVRDQARRSLIRCETAHVAFDERALKSSEPDPEASLNARELLARYEAALGRLSAKTQWIFLRHRLDGLTYPEIAKELNQSVSNVEKHMMKAIAHLDRTLGRS
jgi:RNA polymerase sigma-70 factor (ECF subfamily)